MVSHKWCFNLFMYFWFSFYFYLTCAAGVVMATLSVGCRPGAINPVEQSDRFYVTDQICSYSVFVIHTHTHYSHWCFWKKFLMLIKPAFIWSKIQKKTC